MNFGRGYLELRQQDTEIYDVFWKVPAQGGQPRPGIDIVFPADTVNLSEPRGAFHAGAYSERWRLKRPGGLIGQTVRIDGLPDGCHRRAGARADDPTAPAR